MKRCDKCNINIKGGHNVCPLCQNKLFENDGSDNDPEIFPYIPTIYNQNTLFFKILLFASIIAVVINIIINIMLPKSGLWSLFVLLGVACVWLCVFVAIRKKKNFLKNIVYQVFIFDIFAVIWDIITGWNMWSTTYFIPISFLSSMIAMTITVRVLKIRMSEYIIYLIILGIFGILPAILIFTKLTFTIIPSLICVGGSVIYFAGMFIFEGKELITELKRRFFL